MKKYRVTYEEWECIKEKSIKSKNIDNSEFKGYLGLISLFYVQEKQIFRYNGTETVVCDSGYKWLTILPDNDYYCITVMMDSEYSVIVSYIDILDSQGIDSDSIPYYHDLYLDLIVYPDGTIFMDDLEELDDALIKQDISAAQYQKAKETAEKLQIGLLADKEKFEKFIKNRLGEIMFSNQEMLDIAMKQSAIDINCKVEDFLKEEHVIVHSKIGPLARKYYKDPISCNLVSYGRNIVASIDSKYEEIIKEYIQKFLFYHCFEAPNIHWLDEKLAPYGCKSCFMAEYFLPDVTKLKRLKCEYRLKVMKHEDFAGLYTSDWRNALCEDRKEVDVLGVGAYDGEKLIGLAACSADCDSMWQIGIDVLKNYRRKGIASALTSNLAVEILERGRVPFYCCAWSNIGSVRNAYKSGFVTAWVETTFKPNEIVDEINK